MPAIALPYLFSWTHACLEITHRLIRFVCRSVSNYCFQFTSCCAATSFGSAPCCCSLLSGCQLSDFLIRWGKRECASRKWLQSRSNNISQSLVTRFGNNNKPTKKATQAGGDRRLATEDKRSRIIELLALSLHLHLHPNTPPSSSVLHPHCPFSYITKCNALIYLTWAPPVAVAVRVVCLFIRLFVCLFAFGLKVHLSN